MIGFQNESFYELFKQYVHTQRPPKQTKEQIRQESTSSENNYNNC